MPTPKTIHRHSSEMQLAVPGLIGVLGGMGPLSTVDFMQKLLNATPANLDQEHVPALISSIPQIPDRTEAFRGLGESPLAAIIDCAVRLKTAGVGLIVMPCNTAHLWFDEIQAHVNLPMLHIVDSAVENLLKETNTQVRIGLLATDATIASGLYINRTLFLLSHQSVQWLLPTAVEMIDWVMPGISAVKSGDLTLGQNLLQQAADALQKRGATTVILGCTEIPVVLNSANISIPTVDATAALAKKAVSWSLQERMSKS